jgi:uncharacterized protein HemX
VKPRNSPETAIIYVTGAVIAIAVVAAGIAQVSAGGSGKTVAWIVVAGVIALGAVAWARAFGARRNARAELTSGEEYRRLADEYRRLSDLAITAQEHTDLRLTDLGVQMDALREKLDQMQRILQEVE